MQDIHELIKDNKKYFKNDLAEFIYYRSYSRWKQDLQRRETWSETVERYMSFMKENVGSKFTSEEYAELQNAILHMEVMPSMRLMWSAGDAARRTNVCAYNCSYIAPSKLQDFGEIMYLLMCGTGVGFSAESTTAQALPQIKKQVRGKKQFHVVQDSKEGWADAFVLGMKTWFDGGDINFDYSKLRPAGARLKTMGGKSSGPEPLKELMTFARAKILKRQGKHLRNIDVHDIVCKIGEIVVSGGVRRSALISLSDLDDYEMRHAKEGQFYTTEPQRSLANNSAVYDEKPTSVEFLDEWLALMKSGTGERGIFNRGSLVKQLPARRLAIVGESLDLLGVNPCGEIVLQSKQFCNLSEVVARDTDNEASLLKKTRLAAMLGTYQASLTNFGYLSKKWTQNCETERLLGVSITGQWDCKAVRSASTLRKMREVALKTNEEYSTRLGIRPATAITCTKPSGCTTLDTRIKTDRGILSMQDIFDIEGATVLTADKSWIEPTMTLRVKDENNDWQEITKLYVNGISDVYELTDESGNVYKFTGNHKLKTTEGWKRVDELTVEDDILSF